MNEVSIIGCPILTIPDIKVTAKDVVFTIRDNNGKVLEVIGRTFGTSATIRRNEFNKRIAYSLSKSGASLYYYICFNLNYNHNIIELKHLEVSKETGIGIRSVPSAINELLNKEVIFKTSRTSLYVVNPKCIINCSVSEFEKQYNTFSSKYDVKFNSNNELVYTNKL